MLTNKRTTFCLTAGMVLFTLSTAFSHEIGKLRNPDRKSVV